MDLQVENFWFRENLMFNISELGQISTDDKSTLYQTSLLAITPVLHDLQPWYDLTRRSPLTSYADVARVWHHTVVLGRTRWLPWKVMCCDVDSDVLWCFSLALPPPRRTGPGDPIGAALHSRYSRSGQDPRSWRLCSQQQADQCTYPAENYRRKVSPQRGQKGKIA